MEKYIELTLHKYDKIYNENVKDGIICIYPSKITFMIPIDKEIEYQANYGDLTNSKGHIKYTRLRLTDGYECNVHQTPYQIHELNMNANY